MTDFHSQHLLCDNDRVVWQLLASIFLLEHFETGHLLKSYNSVNPRWLKIFKFTSRDWNSRGKLKPALSPNGHNSVWSLWSFSWVAKWYLPLNFCCLFPVTIHSLSNASRSFIIASGCQLEQQYCPGRWSSVSGDEADSCCLIKMFKTPFCTNKNARKDIMRSNSNF